MGYSERSRSYTPQGGTELSPGDLPGKAVQFTLDSVLHGNMEDDRAGVSRGHSCSTQRDEGPNSEKGKGIETAKAVACAPVLPTSPPVSSHLVNSPKNGKITP
jgi:hypothetical protein